jgi:hypothetical protein
MERPSRKGRPFAFLRTAPQPKSSPRREGRSAGPGESDERDAGAADRPLGSGCCGGAVLLEQARRQQLHEEPEAERDEKRIVEQAEDGDEVRDEVDRRERISRDDKAEDARVPRAARIARGEPGGVRVDPEALRQRGAFGSGHRPIGLSSEGAGAP